MKTLSLTQPYATLVAIAARYPELGKHNETRSWGLSHKLPLTIAIHAAKGLGPVGGQRGLKELCGTEPFCSVLNAAMKAWDTPPKSLREMAERPFMPLGAIVAVVDITALARVDYYEPQPDDADQWRGPFLNFGDHGETLPGEPELSFGDYSVGRFVWKMENIRALPEPVPCRGQLGLWELDAATLAVVERQL